jgi:hypothetical protein
MSSNTQPRSYSLGGTSQTSKFKLRPKGGYPTTNTKEALSVHGSHAMQAIWGERCLPVLPVIHATDLLLAWMKDYHLTGMTSYHQPDRSHHCSCRSSTRNFPKFPHVFIPHGHHVHVPTNTQRWGGNGNHQMKPFTYTAKCSGSTSTR